MFMYFGFHQATINTSGAVRFQNSAQNNDATFFDWNGHTVGVGDGFQGFDGFGTIGSNVTTEVNPSKRGNRFGAIPICLRQTTNGEFRGKLRYYWAVPPNMGSIQLMPDRNGNWYYVLPLGFRQVNTFKPAFGPIPANLAKPF